MSLESYKELLRRGVDDALDNGVVDAPSVISWALNRTLQWLAERGEQLSPNRRHQLRAALQIVFGEDVDVEDDGEALTVVMKRHAEHQRAQGNA